MHLPGKHLLLTVLLLQVLASSACAQAKDRYAEPRLCIACHPRVYDTYRYTGMARSFYRPSASNTIEDYSKVNPFYQAATGAYYAMALRGGRQAERPRGIEADGRQ